MNYNKSTERGMKQVAPQREGLERDNVSLLHKSTHNNLLIQSKPLLQSELADGWRLVVPKIRYNTNDNIKSNNIYRSKINVAQLPYHLWHKLKRLRNNKIYEKSHIFYLQTTEVDNDIMELVNLLMSMGQTSHKREKIILLLKKIKASDVHGWPIIKAMNLYQLKNSDILL